MHNETRQQATEQVLTIVKRARESLAHIGDGSVNANGVFHHPPHSSPSSWSGGCLRAMAFVESPSLVGEGPSRSLTKAKRKRLVAGLTPGSLQKSTSPTDDAGSAHVSTDCGSR
jgi:hypothetical protein